MNDGKEGEEMKDEQEEDELEGDDEEELTKKFGEIKFSDNPVIYENEEKNKKKKQKKDNEVKAYLGTTKHLKEGEVLEFDNKAYDMFHRANTEW